MRSGKPRIIRRGRTGRPAISGIIAALIMFVMLFTIGTGYFLWVSDNNQVYSQALVDRNNANHAQQSESLSLTPSVPGSDVDIVARNTGGMPIILASVMVTDLSGNVKKMCTSSNSASCGQGINPGGVTPPIDTTYQFTPGTSVMIKVITQRGSVFSAVYLSPTLSTVLSANSLPAGGSVFDTAKLNGASGTASGTVTYYFSSSSLCPNGGATMVGGPVSVVSGNVPNSASQQFSTPGTYYWYAVYSGDTNDAGATSPCEALTVGPATGVTITTQLSSQVVNTGQPVYDTAFLSGATSNAGGTVTYRWFSNGACTGPANPDGSVTVVNAQVPNSAPVSFTAQGSYSWNATYSGDANNNAAKSQCEPLTVIAGGGVTPIGSFAQVPESFKFYIESNCNPSSTSGAPNCLGDGVYAKGYYGYGLSFTQASDCDDNDSQCFNDVFRIDLTNQDPLGRSISLSSESFLYLSGVCLNGGTCGSEEGIPFAQGYWIIGGICNPPSACNGNGAVPFPYSSTLTVNAGSTITLYFFCDGPCTSGTPQPPQNNPGPGNYLSVSVDLFGQYSDGTPFGQAIPFISSYVSPVQITGCARGISFPGPSCWAASNPTTQLGGTPGSSMTLRVDGFPSQPTNPFPITVNWVNVTGTTSVVGSNPSCNVNTLPCYVTFTIPNWADTTYYGIYVTSDGVNNAYATVAVQGTTTIATTLSSTTIPVGGSLHDSATLSGAKPNAGGTVTYVYYSGSVCQGSSTTVSTVAVTNGVVPNSATVVFNTAGAYSWQASYSGDALNSGSTSPCEPMTVSQNTPTITTQLTQSSVHAGQPVGDTATLIGATATAGGTVTYEYFNNNQCSGSPTTLITVTVTNHIVPGSGSASINTVGTFYLVAVYSGDVNNAGATSSCGAEQLTVTQAQPTLSTSLSPNPANVNQQVTDSAALSGATSTAGGTVQYNYFNNGGCTGGGTLDGTVTVSGGIVPNSPSHGFSPAGSYSWNAVYSGDANNQGISSPCEPLTVKATTSTGVVCSPSPILVGTTSTCTATVAGFIGTITGETITWSKIAGSGTVSFSSTTCALSAGGTCSVTVTGTGAGSATIQASYPGDANNVGSTGSAVLTINKGALSVVQSNIVSCFSGGTNCSSSTFTVSFSSNPTSGDTIVVAVSTLRTSSQTCRSVTSVSDNRGDTFTQVGSSVNAPGSSVDCAHSSIWYATAATSLSVTVTVSLSNSLGSADSGVVVIYQLRNAATPPTFVTGSCPPSCSTSQSTGSLTVTAGSFLVGTSSVCQTTGQSNLAITTQPAGFTASYGIAPARAQYVGFNLPGGPGSQTFTVGTTSTPACWSDIGAQFLDPPPKAESPAVSSQVISPISILAGTVSLALPLMTWSAAAIFLITVLWVAKPLLSRVRTKSGFQLPLSLMVMGMSIVMMFDLVVSLSLSDFKKKESATGVSSN